MWCSFGDLRFQSLVRKKKNNNNNNNNKDSTEIRKTIKDSNVLESFN